MSPDGGKMLKAGDGPSIRFRPAHPKITLQAEWIKVS
jgi:hypothetical protein